MKNDNYYATRSNFELKDFDVLYLYEIGFKPLLFSHIGLWIFILGSFNLFLGAPTNYICISFCVGK